MVSNPIESASKVIGIENTLVPGVALVVSKNIDGIGVGTASGGFGAAVPHSKAGQGGRASGWLSTECSYRGLFIMLVLAGMITYAAFIAKATSFFSWLAPMAGVEVQDTL